MNLWWYLARAGGLVAWGLLAGSVGWGLVLSSRIVRSRPRPAWLLDVHRFAGGLAVVFTAIHVGALVADSSVHFGLADALLPLVSRWRPAAVAWGIVAMYLLIAIEVTSVFMKRLSRRVWRGIHRMSFFLFVLASVHALTAGTDVETPVVIVTTVAFAGVISFLFVVRVLTRGSPAVRRDSAADQSELQRTASTSSTSASSARGVRCVANQ